MEPIIDPVPKEVLMAELTPQKLLKDTNKAGNKIYLVDYQDSPNVLREVGRLREIAFRDGGGDTENLVEHVGETPFSFRCWGYYNRQRTRIQVKVL